MIPFVATYLCDPEAAGPHRRLHQPPRRAGRALPDRLGHRRFAMIAGETTSNDRAAGSPPGFAQRWPAGLAFPGTACSRIPLGTRGRGRRSAAAGCRRASTARGVRQRHARLWRAARSLCARHRRPPQVSVTGFDDIEMAGALPAGDHDAARAGIRGRPARGRVDARGDRRQGRAARARALRAPADRARDDRAAGRRTAGASRWRRTARRTDGLIMPGTATHPPCPDPRAVAAHAHTLRCAVIELVRAGPGLRPAGPRRRRDLREAVLLRTARVRRPRPIATAYLSTAHNRRLPRGARLARHDPGGLARYLKDGSELEINVSERLGPLVEGDLRLAGSGPSVAPAWRSRDGGAARLTGCTWCSATARCRRAGLGGRDVRGPHGLDNLCVVVDLNAMQVEGHTDQRGEAGRSRQVGGLRLGGGRRRRPRPRRAAGGLARRARRPAPAIDDHRHHGGRQGRAASSKGSSGTT